jgi:hypothetical protein
MTGLVTWVDRAELRRHWGFLDSSKSIDRIIRGKSTVQKGMVHDRHRRLKLGSHAEGFRITAAKMADKKPNPATTPRWY